MGGLMDVLESLTDRETVAVIGCLQREISRIERGESNWLLYEEEYRSSLAKLRARLLMSIRAISVTRQCLEALDPESLRLLRMARVDVTDMNMLKAQGIQLPRQSGMPEMSAFADHKESSAGSDHPAEAEQGVKNGSDASGNAGPDNHDVDITA